MLMKIIGHLIYNLGHSIKIKQFKFYLVNKIEVFNLYYKLNILINNN